MEEKLNQLSIGKAFLIGIGIAAFYYFIMYDDGAALSNNITGISQTLSQKQSELSQMQQALAEAQQIEVEAKKISEDMNQVKQVAPEGYSSLELMKVLSGEAKVVGANIVSITAATSGMGAEEEKQVFVPVSVTIQLEATFNQLMLFLSNLTKVQRLVMSKKLEFALKDPNRALETASPILTFSGQFQAFRYNPAGVQANAQ